MRPTYWDDYRPRGASPIPDGVPRLHLCGMCWARKPESELVPVEAKVGMEFRCRACLKRDQDWRDGLK